VPQYLATGFPEAAYAATCVPINLVCVLRAFWFQFCCCLRATCTTVTFPVVLPLPAHFSYPHPTPHCMWFFGLDLLLLLLLFHLPIPPLQSSSCTSLVCYLFIVRRFFICSSLCATWHCSPLTPVLVGAHSLLLFVPCYSLFTDQDVVCPFRFVTLLTFVMFYLQLPPLFCCRWFVKTTLVHCALFSRYYSGCLPSTPQRAARACTRTTLHTHALRAAFCALHLASERRFSYYHNTPKSTSTRRKIA